MKNWQLATLLALIFILVEIGVTLHFFNVQDELIQTSAIQNAELFNRSLTEFRTLYTSEVAAPMSSEGLNVSHDYPLKGGIPLPATMAIMLGERIGNFETGAHADLYSPYPFPWRKKKDQFKDQFAQDAWKALNENPNQPYFVFEETDGRRLLRYATADTMRPSCIDCHNSHPDTPKADWKVGDVRGVLEVNLPMDEAVGLVNNNLRSTFFVLTILAMAASAILALVLIRLRTEKFRLAVKVQKATADLRAEINEKIAAESALKQQEARTRALIEDCLDGVILFDSEGKIKEWNPCAEKMFGWSKKETENDFPAHNILPKRLLPHLNPSTDYLPKRQIVEATRRNGELFPAEVAMVPLMDQGKRMYGSFIRDITERARHEKEVTDALDQARQAGRAKDEFLAMMSHELRTPMNAILGFAQLMQMSPDQFKHGPDEIIKAGEHLLRLIEDVLDLATIEANALSVDKEDVPALPLIQDSLALIAPMAAEMDITLTDKLEMPVNLHIHADGLRLKQALLNLLSNSIKYNHKGGRVTLTNTVSQKTLTIRVTDTAKGLTHEQMERLFEPFERLGITDGSVPGAGIGLTIARKLMQLMNGKIGVSSVTGEGSTFWLEIPLATQPYPQAMPAIESKELKTPPEFTNKPRLVLYIEDNPANLRLIETTLGVINNLDIRTTPLPELGISMAREFLPDLILLDIQLPGMDGFEVLKCLREDDRTQSIPVIGISAKATPSDIEAARAAGFNDYLTKPLKLDHFFTVIKSYLDQK